MFHDLGKLMQCAALSALRMTEQSPGDSVEFTQTYQISGIQLPPVFATLEGSHLERRRAEGKLREFWNPG